MKYQISKTSRLGNRIVNEDRLGVAETREAILLVLADGMGGYRGGQIASKALVNHVLRKFQRDNFPITDPKAYLKELIVDAHLAVIRAGNEQYPPIEPRTTCVVCLIQQGCVTWAHVGDSRLYMFRQGQLLQRTVDHSRIEEMRRKSAFTAAEIANHPQRHLVTRCVGYQQHPPIPTISETLELEKYDMLMLCTDGLWGPLDDLILAKNLCEHTLPEAVERLAYQAEFRSYPEADNISLIALRWISAEPDQADVQQTEPDELLETLHELNQAMGNLKKNLS